MLGVGANAVAVIIGALIGGGISKLSVSLKKTLMQVSGLFVVGIGLQMFLKTSNSIYILISIVLGACLGEGLHLQERVHNLSKRFLKEAESDGISSSFMMAAIFFCAGSMGIVGCIESGLSGDNTTLFSKSIIDGVTALIFASTFSKRGIMFASIPLFLYQAILYVFAYTMGSMIDLELLDMLLPQISATGGILIMAIGCNMFDIINIKVMNLLPAMLFCIIIGIFQFIV